MNHPKYWKSWSKCLCYWPWLAADRPAWAPSTRAWNRGPLQTWSALTRNSRSELDLFGAPGTPAPDDPTRSRPHTVLWGWRWSQFDAGALSQWNCRRKPSGPKRRRFGHGGAWPLWLRTGKRARRCNGTRCPPKSWPCWASRAGRVRRRQGRGRCSGRASGPSRGRHVDWIRGGRSRGQGRSCKRGNRHRWRRRSNRGPGWRRGGGVWGFGSGSGLGLNLGFGWRERKSRRVRARRLHGEAVGVPSGAWWVNQGRRRWWSWPHETRWRWT